MTKPLRVLYVWQARYPWDIRVDKIARALQQAGATVEILARRCPGDSESSPDPANPGILIHRAGPVRPRAASLPVPGNPFWSQAIRGRVAAFRPNLIIARDIPLALPALDAGERFGVPVVIDMAEHYPEAMRTWKKYQANPVSRFLVNTLRLPDRIERRAVRRAIAILPVCEEQKERLLQEYGGDPNRIVPVLNTPERTRIPAAPTPLAKRAGSIFGYHGIFAQDRDLPTVVRGFSLAAARNVALRLILCGDGESLADVRREVNDSPYRDRIELRGRFRPEEAARLYAEVDFGVVSWQDNAFSNATIANKFFDYAAFGKPILYTDVRPMARLMLKMRSGIPFRGGNPDSAGEAMLALTRADYDTMARSGRAAIESDFNWDADVQRMLTLLRRLV